ncbi:MAG: hypothetical protein ACE5I3_07100 [Phycisphaerae bacterium]
MMLGMFEPRSVEQGLVHSGCDVRQLRAPVWTILLALPYPRRFSGGPTTATPGAATAPTAATTLLTGPPAAAPSAGKRSAQQTKPNNQEHDCTWPRFAEREFAVLPSQ